MAYINCANAPENQSPIFPPEYCLLRRTDNDCRVQDVNLTTYFDLKFMPLWLQPPSEDLLMSGAENTPAPYSEWYEIPALETHRRASSPLNAPGLNRHIAIIVERNKDILPSWTDHLLLLHYGHCRISYLHRKFEKGVDRNFFDIRDTNMRSHLQIEEVTPGADCWAFRRSEDVDIVWRGINTKVILELHGDFLTITTHMDGALHGESNDLNEAMGRLYDFYDSNTWGLDHPNPDTQNDDISKRFFETIWQDFQADVFSDLMIMRKCASSIAGQFDNIDQIYKIFYDSRLTLLLDGTKENCVSPRQHDFSYKRKGAFSSLNKSNQSIARSLAILPAHIENIEIQYCACTMVQNRAVYVSTLGRRPSHATDPAHRCIPVTFVITFEHNQPSQIGRLIQRVNYLGVLRHMTLRDILKIRTAGIQLSKLEEQLDRLSILLEQEKPTADKSNLHDIIEDFAKWSESFAKNLDQEGTSLSKRIQRCRLSRDYFEIFVNSLQCKRIKSYQPYDEFVSERLYPAFHFIERMSLRLQNLRERSEGLNSRIAQRHEQEANHQAHRLARVVESVAISYYGGYMLLNIIGPNDTVVFDGFFLKWKGLIFTISGLAAAIYFLSGVNITGWLLKPASAKTDKDENQEK